MEKIYDDEGRKCTMCGKFLTWKNFSKNRHSITGHTYRCKKCDKKYTVDRQKRSEELKSEYNVRKKTYAELNEEYYEMRKRNLSAPQHLLTNNIGI